MWLRRWLCRHISGVTMGSKGQASTLLARGVEKVWILYNSLLSNPISKRMTRLASRSIMTHPKLAAGEFEKIKSSFKFTFIFKFNNFASKTIKFKFKKDVASGFLS
jgi:hypothetical protein